MYCVYIVRVHAHAKKKSRSPWVRFVLIFRDTASIHRVRSLVVFYFPDALKEPFVIWDFRQNTADWNFCKLVHVFPSSYLIAETESGEKLVLFRKTIRWWIKPSVAAGTSSFNKRNYHRVVLLNSATKMLLILLLLYFLRFGHRDGVGSDPEPSSTFSWSRWASAVDKESKDLLNPDLYRLANGRCQQFSSPFSMMDLHQV